MHRFRTLIVTTALLGYTVAGGLSGNGPSVICIEPGAHIRIEPIGACCCAWECCGPDDAAAVAGSAAPGLSAAVGSGRCCACIDIPLSTERDQSSAAPRVAVELRANVVHALGSIHRIDSTTPVDHISNRAVRRALDPRAAILDTVVLRC